MDGKNASTSFTYGVSCGSTETDSVAHLYTSLHGRARAATVVQELTKKIQWLAGEVPTRDFVWARLALDSAFDQILFGHQTE